MRRLVLSILLVLLWSSPASAQEVSIRVAGWNMESREFSDIPLRQQIADEDGGDIWGLCEVRIANAPHAFGQEAEAREGGDFATILGTAAGASANAENSKGS